MALLPVLSGKEVVRTFERFEWRVVRQSSSHIIMTKDGEIATLSVPIIGKLLRERCEV